MPDTLTIVYDTLRTMMGATAAEPYIKAIERNIAAEIIEGDRKVTCGKCGTIAYVGGPCGACGCPTPALYLAP